VICTQLVRQFVRMLQLAVPLALVCAGLAAFAQPKTPPRAHIILVGDSTMQARTGYGDALCLLVAPDVACSNLAKGGRSTSSFRAEGRWAQVQQIIQGNGPDVPTWVLIQFGHNDQPGKPGRSTDLQTEYPQNLVRYVNEARQLGGHPVLVTPLTRRTFHGAHLENNLLPWAESMRKVATELDAPLIDLNTVSFQAVQAMGQLEADTLAMEPPPTVAVVQEVRALSPASVEAVGVVKSTFDRTHVGEKGARLFAAMVLAGARQIAELGACFRAE